MTYQPLSERMRPSNINDVVGHDHLLKKGKIIHEIINNKLTTSLILWGPPGSGKTTLARLIAQETEAEFIELSAVSSGKPDIIKVIDHAKGNQRLGINTILFIDEIHRFNKAQQDALLPFVENGTIILIGATTENPSFEVIKPLLSRSRVIVLEQLHKNDIVTIIKKAAKVEKISTTRLPLKSIDLLATLSGGDARIALGNLELALRLTNGPLTTTIIEAAAQKRIPGYDKNGENHYNIISAFIKSMRGSDVNASLYYLARMIQAGEDPKFIARRMIIFASEDIGIAASPALNLAVSTFEAVERIGMPECTYNLFHCAMVLAKCKKSRLVANAMSIASQAASEYPDIPVPIHLRNAPTQLMQDLEYGKGYEWKADFHHYKRFLPEELKEFTIFDNNQPDD